MRLISVQVTGYKRFEEPATLWVASPLIAIVGPNEAGKTSFLQAMQHLSQDASFARSEYTDRREPDGEPVVVSARYAVEAADREVCASLLDAKTDYTLTVSKSAGHSKTEWSLEPPLYRDVRPRQDAIEHLRRLVADELFIERMPVGDGSDDEIVNTELHAQTADLADRLDKAEEDLTSGALQAMEQFVGAVRERHGDQPPDQVAQLLSRLDGLYEHEEADNPHDQAGTLLVQRRPMFLFFRGQHRTLQTNYEWADHETAPAALANLCHLAGVDYGNYRAIALDRDRRDELQTLERAANAKLEREFEAWAQAELSVVFRADHEGLQLQVLERETLRNVPFEQRSAGLRYFVALVAFTARYAADRPAVLLIDEAETHLHYGGQADLIRVFERQTVAHAIIYTTHSIGCLPEDLGTTIRALEPTASERTVLRDSLWEGGAGLTPLMLAMGATALAFTPSRFAVISEGRSDAILFPSLLRESRPKKYARHSLGFQVAPGLAYVARDAAADLELDAGNVAYVHDADAGGRAHAAKLPERAHREHRVIELGDGKEEGLCVEDFIERALYVEAVNAVLARTRETNDRIDPKQLSPAARPGDVDTWCEQRGLEPLSKTLIAQEVVRLGRDQGRGLVEPVRKAQISKLYERLRKVLKIPKTV